MIDIYIYIQTWWTRDLFSRLWFFWNGQIIIRPKQQKKKEKSMPGITFTFEFFRSKSNSKDLRHSYSMQWMSNYWTENFVSNKSESIEIHNTRWKQWHQCEYAKSSGQIAMASSKLMKSNKWGIRLKKKSQEPNETTNKTNNKKQTEQC